MTYNPETGGNSVSSLKDIDLTTLTALEAAFNNMYNVSEACDYAGISRDTYYRWLTIEDFAERMEMAKRLTTRKLKEIVVKQAIDGDGGMALKLLQVKDPDFKQKSEVTFNPQEAKYEEALEMMLDDPNNQPAALRNNRRAADEQSTDED